jgi:hypothetical protein
MHRWSLTLIVAAAMLPGDASAASLAVSVSTDRGDNAVYEPGDKVEIQARCSSDANLLVYDIDAEGYIHVLFPHGGNGGLVAGQQTIMIPDEKASDQLVVQGPVGQGYIVAVASTAPFKDLPWYLRPYNPQAEGVGYVGGPDSSEEEQEGVTRDGKIVGDPFVAIERIRRRVLSDPEDREVFATSYVSYYVHEQVAYPRYVCDDCHRPGHYAWWDGFDPYYASCSVVDLRVNFGWYWGWPYWSGYMPYYAYVVNPYCAPYYQPWVGNCYSSWDGYGQWNTLWGSHLTRYKPGAPPTGYVSPAKHQWDRNWQNSHPAPGYLANTAGSHGRGPAQRMPVSSDPEARVVKRTDWSPGGASRKPAARAPVSGAPRDDARSGGMSTARSRQGAQRAPAGEVNRGGQSGGSRNSERIVAQRYERPAPSRGESQRNARPEPSRYERNTPSGSGSQRNAPSRGESQRYARPEPSRYERNTPSGSGSQSYAPSRGESQRYARPEPSRYERSTPSGSRSQSYAPSRGGSQRYDRPAAQLQRSSQQFQRSVAQYQRSAPQHQQSAPMRQSAPQFATPSAPSFGGRGGGGGWGHGGGRGGH